MDANNRPKLYRSPNGLLGGVCGGAADFFSLDVSLVRLATTILILFLGLSLWVYILLWIVIPKAPQQINA